MLFQEWRSPCRRSTAQQHRAEGYQFLLMRNQTIYVLQQALESVHDKLPGQKEPMCAAMVQGWHEETDSLFKAAEKVPEGQAVGELAPGGQKCPTGQSTFLHSL